MSLDFLAVWIVCAMAVAALLGLFTYLGYQAGYAKAISTVELGMEVAAHERGQNAIPKA